MAIDQPLALLREDRLAPHRVTFEPRPRRVVVEGESAQDHRRRLGALLEVSLLANEVLRLDLGPGQSGFNQIEFLLELVAVGAVALFQPSGRAVNANANRRDPMRLASLPDRIPQTRSLLERHVDFPAQL